MALVEPFLIMLTTSIMLTAPVILLVNVRQWARFTTSMSTIMCLAFIVVVATAQFVDETSPIADVVRGYYRLFIRPDILNGMLVHLRFPDWPHAKYFPPWVAAESQVQ